MAILNETLNMQTNYNLHIISFCTFFTKNPFFKTCAGISAIFVPERFPSHIYLTKYTQSTMFSCFHYIKSR